MAVQIHFEGTADEVRAEMRKLLGGQIGGQEGESTPSEKKVTKTPKAEPTGKAEAAPKSEAPPSEAKGVVASFDEVKVRIPKLMDKLGKPGLVEFLATFDGAKKGSEIKESRYAEFIQKADEKLA